MGDQVANELRGDSEDEGHGDNPHGRNIWAKIDKALPLAAYVAEGEGVSTRVLMLVVLVLVIRALARPRQE